MEEEQEQDHPVRNLVLSVCDLKQHGDVPPARCGSQTVTMGTRMYLHGGADEKQSYDDLHLLEIEQMKWTELRTEGRAPSARYGHSVAGHNTDLVLFGGLASEGGASSLLPDEAGTVSRPPPFSAGLGWGHSGQPDNGLYVLQTQSLKWEMPTCSGSAPSPRVFHSAVTANDTYVVFGGCSSSDFATPLNDIHMLDLKTMQWSSPSCAGEAPSPRYAHKAVYVPNEDNMLVFGGTQGEATQPAEPGKLYALHMGTSTWSTVEVLGTPAFERSFHSLDLIGKWIFVFAGKTSTSITDLYILDVANRRWARPLYEGQVNVRAHASAVLHDKLIVFGGVRDRAPEAGQPAARSKDVRISKKLFFLNVLEVKGGGGMQEGDFKFKLVTVGDSGVGKSCLLTRFVQDWYSDFHVSTIGVDFKTVITMVKGRLVKLQLWDTAGQERFSVVTGNYYRNSDGFVFVYDATSRASFDHIDQWLSQVQQHHDCGPSTVKILIGNKHDLAGEVVVSEEEGRAKAEKLGATFICTSAKTAANVDMAFLTAAQNLVEVRRRTKQQPKTVQLGSQGAALNSRPQEKAKCCAGGGLGGKSDASSGPGGVGPRR